MSIPDHWPAELAASPLAIHPMFAEDARRAWWSGEQRAALIRPPSPQSKPARAEVYGIPILGPLFSGPNLDPGLLGYTSYRWLRAQFAIAAEASASDIALVVNSPGGGISGIDVTVDALRRLTARKRVTAYVEGMAASAAYWLAAQAQEIVMTRLSEVGSIGVITAHVDISKMLEQMGVNVSLIHSGKTKADGNPFEALPDDIRADIQARIDDVRQEFADSVAQGRGSRLTAAQALATEARMYPALPRTAKIKSATAMGLADRIGSIAEDRLARAPKLASTTAATVIDPPRRASAGPVVWR